MAGFFGLFDYSKPGKGVDKNGPQKKRFFLFFELFFRKFWKMITLNLLYVLFCIPIVTIGPATAAMARIMKEFACERPVFLWSDFWEHFKKNFKQGFLMELLDIVVIFFAYIAYHFYQYRVGEDPMYYIPMALTMGVIYLAIVMNYYIFLMIATVDMSLPKIIKNSLLLALGMRTNILTFIITTALIMAAYFFWPIGILLTLVILCSLCWFIIAFNSYQYIDKYVISPYYEKTGERRPDLPYTEEDFDEDDIIFEDIGSQEKPLEQPSAKGGKKGKVIK